VMLAGDLGTGSWEYAAIWILELGI
jgi:hypothetical protein